MVQSWVIGQCLPQDEITSIPIMLCWLTCMVGTDSQDETVILIAICVVHCYQWCGSLLRFGPHGRCGFGIVQCRSNGHETSTRLSTVSSANMLCLTKEAEMDTICLVYFTLDRAAFISPSVLLQGNWLQQRLKPALINASDSLYTNKVHKHSPAAYCWAGCMLSPLTTWASLNCQAGHKTLNKWKGVT